MRCLYCIILISCKKNGINIDVSSHMTVNKNSVHHKAPFPFEIFKSMVSQYRNKLIASADVLCVL